MASSNIPRHTRWAAEAALTKVFNMPLRPVMEFSVETRNEDMIDPADHWEIKNQKKCGMKQQNFWIKKQQTEV